MVNGPIATLHNPKGTPTNFVFVVRRDGGENLRYLSLLFIMLPVWSGSMTPGASTTLLSNGFLNLWESYTVDYVNDNVLSRNYDFVAEVSGHYFDKLNSLNKFFSDPSLVQSRSRQLLSRFGRFPQVDVSEGQRKNDCLWVSCKINWLMEHLEKNGKITEHCSLGKLAGSVQNDFCKSFTLNVTKGKQTATGPRFVVEVATGNLLFSGHKL